MLKTALLLGFLIVVNGALGQERTFNIEFPDHWIPFQRSHVLNAVQNRYKFSDEIKEKILADVHSVQLYGYVAPPNAKSVYRPNIQVLLIRNESQNLSQFNAMARRSLEDFKTKLKDLQVIDPVQEVIAANRKSIYTKITASVKVKSGGTARFISRIYAIPVGRYFYQITFNDSKEYDCEAEFKKVFSTMKLE